MSITPGLATIPPQGRRVIFSILSAHSRSFFLLPLEVATYLSPLIDRAKELIDPSRYAKTPLFLRATAGMRVIPSDLQQKILIQVRNVFSQSGFRFQNSWASVISGQEEGTSIRNLRA